MGAQVHAIHSPSNTLHPQQRSAEVVHSRGQSSAVRGGFPRTASQHRLLRVRAFLLAAGLPLGALGGPHTIPPLPQSRQKPSVMCTARIAWIWPSEPCSKTHVNNQCKVGPDAEVYGQSTDLLPGNGERLRGVHRPLGHLALGKSSPDSVRHRDAAIGDACGQHLEQCGKAI